jgi:hypothetical protein
MDGSYESLPLRFPGKALPPAGQGIRLVALQELGGYKHFMTIVQVSDSKRSFGNLFHQIIPFFRLPNADQPVSL